MSKNKPAWLATYEAETLALMARRVTLFALLLIGFHSVDLYLADPRDVLLFVEVVGIISLVAALARLRPRWSPALATTLIGLQFFLHFGAASDGVDLTFAVDILLLLLGSALILPLRGLVVLAICGVCWLFVPLMFLSWHGTMTHGDIVEVVYYLGVASVVALTGGYASERLRRAEAAARHEVAVQRDRADTLLHNMLPPSIAERLKREDSPIADSFGDVTVMFADIVGFTGLAERVSPKQLVIMLNALFSEFDQLTHEHGLEKIKTIGDAYMVAGGLPEARGDHAQAVARMALELRTAVADFAAQHDQPLRVRIGINSGPVVAGVIGTKKLIYDLWGDAVNTASRMESHGEPDCIQVTETTCRLLRPTFELEPRGEIEIKGKGVMNVYRLLGERDVANSD